jgi:hypothetical protein
LQGTKIFAGGYDSTFVIAVTQKFLIPENMKKEIMLVFGKKL